MSAMRAPVPMPVRQGTPEWLEMRKTGIGSSDAPIIAGEYGSVLELWAEKSGLVERQEPDQDTARLFEWGHRLEPVVADWYADETGRSLERVTRLLRHPEVDYAFASLDRRVKGERRLVEIKTTRFGWDDPESVPGRVQVQVQHQLWVTGYDVADVAVLTGGSEPRIYPIERDDGFISDLAYLEAEFWGWVQSGTRPPVDGSENARSVLSKLHPRNDGTMQPRTLQAEALAAKWRTAKDTAKEAEAHADTLGNALRALIADTDGIDGLVTWKKNHDSVKVDWEALADELLPLLDTERQPLIAKHSRTVEGARVLRSTWKGISA